MAAAEQIDPTEFARENLAAFAIGSASARGQRYDVARHLRLIARELMEVEAAIRRGEPRHVMIFAPPRHGKTELVSKYFVSWFLGRNPGRSVMAASYGQDLADDNGRKVLDTMRDGFFGSAFPEATLRADSKSASRFGLRQGGAYYGVGAGGALTGRGADLLVIDDPIKGSEEAFSESVRKKKQEWFVGDAYSRRAPGAGVILMNTRWHEDDLAGFCLRELSHLGWRVISLPALAEPTEKDPDPLGRVLGEPLWPERFPASFLEPIRKAGSYWWSALYQQRPQPEGGGMLKRGWWKRYALNPRELAKSCDRVVLSADFTFKDTDGSDYVVIQAWGQRGDAEFFLLDQVRGRMDFPATCQALVSFAAKWSGYRECFIEDKANGPAVIATLGKKLPRLIAIDPQGGKIARTAAVSGLIEAGNVFLPELDTDGRPCPWVGDFVGECAAFPTGKHDDQVDAMTQALARLSTKPKPPRGTVETWAGV